MEKNVLINIIVNYFIQILSTIGVIIVFGVLISLCSRRFYSNFGSKQMVVCYATGFIGTPVHECAHALFCLIFAHKITKIKLFQINSNDGILGYVEHSYNHKNVYQRIGNFFIGIAPIVVISALLSLFAYILIPTILIDILSLAQDIALNGMGNFFITIYLIFCAFFSGVTTWQWWLFIIIGTFFALHMTLSKEDIQGSKSGLLVFLVVILIVDIVLGVIGKNVLGAFSSFVFCIGAVLGTFLVLSLLISFVAYLLSIIYKITFGRKHV